MPKIKLTPQSGGKPCSYIESLDAIENKKIRGEIISLVMNSTLSAVAVMRILMDKYGFVLGASTIQKHRARGCTSCNRKALEQWQ